MNHLSFFTQKDQITVNFLVKQNLEISSSFTVGPTNISTFNTSEELNWNLNVKKGTTTIKRKHERSWTNGLFSGGVDNRDPFSVDRFSPFAVDEQLTTRDCYWHYCAVWSKNSLTECSCTMCICLSSSAVTFSQPTITNGFYLGLGIRDWVCFSIMIRHSCLRERFVPNCFSTHYLLLFEIWKIKFRANFTLHPWTLHFVPLCLIEL